MKKTRIAVLIGMILMSGLVSVVAFAHLCDDVFSMAEDHLAVKVDVRDGQLRIGEAGGFRVYVLNTMPSDILDLQLEVLTEDFEATVSPSPRWNNFPCLRSIMPNTEWRCANPRNEKGKKEFFEVALKRKAGLKPGKYKIGLRFYTDQNMWSDFFKVDDIDTMISVMVVPEKAGTLEIDGSATREEWRNSLLCSSLYEHRSPFFSRFKENVPSDVQTRFRFSHDKETLFCLIDFQTRNDRDLAAIYVAGDAESEPVVITADLQKKRAMLSGKEEIEIKTVAKGKKMELELPFERLGLKKGQESFYINVTRQYNDTMTYWRGNRFSLMEPLVYANVLLR